MLWQYDFPSFIFNFSHLSKGYSQMAEYLIITFHLCAHITFGK